MRSHTPAERALHLIGVMSGKSLLEIWRASGAEDNPTRQLTQKDYDSIRIKYVQASKKQAIDLGLRGVSEGEEVWSDLWDHCVGKSF